jgi:hypothetical protein
MGRHKKICECCQKVHEPVPKKEYDPVPPPKNPTKSRKTPDSIIRAVNKYRQKEYPKEMARKQALEYYYKHKDEVLKRRKIVYESNKETYKEYQKEYQKRYRQTIKELKQLPFYGESFEIEQVVVIPPPPIVCHIIEDDKHPFENQDGECCNKSRNGWGCKCGDIKTGNAYNDAYRNAKMK